MKISYYKHGLGEEEIKEVSSTINSLFLTTGPKTSEFEDSFSNLLNTKHCLGVTSWTMGNFITLKALEIGPGDLVLTTPLTYIATANTILHTGAEVIFADVDPVTGNLDPEKVKEVIATDHDNKIKAIIVVHLYGQMLDMEVFKDIADKNNLYLLEDCAHCVEGSRNGIRPGNLSDAAIFSFYATKNLTCGEGGAIVTNRSDLYEKLIAFRLHGVDTYAKDQHKSSRYRHWDMTLLGYKCNMNDLQAALLVPQLKKLENNRRTRAKIANLYDKLLADIAQVKLTPVLDNSVHAHHLYTIRVFSQIRDDLLFKLSSSGVGVGVNFRVVHLMKYYVERYGFKLGDFPIAESIGSSTISLPLYPSLCQPEQEYVAEKIKSILAELEA